MAHALEVTNCIFQNYIFFSLEMLKKQFFYLSRSLLDTYKGIKTCPQFAQLEIYNTVSKQNRKSKTFLNYSLFRKQDSIMI